MNALAQKIARIIEATGPVSVADYMALCLFDPDHGYYTTRQPFGADGDFITAPEVSQMFGELVAVWLFSAWTVIDRPSPVTLAEIGPGRGTLMKDVLRTLTRLAPEARQKVKVAMIEASPALAGAQKTALAGCGFEVTWHGSVATLPAEPLLIVGNELFDAIPARQFVKVEGKWRERVVALDDDGKLCLAAGASSLDPALLPPDAGATPDGTIFEASPARTALMQTIAEHIAAHGGAGLFIDYGHAEPGFGDTLQAIRRHAYEDVLKNPGEADLTSHVDFSALAQTARFAGTAAHLTTQGEFLLGMGLLERAGRLGGSADQAGRDRISGEVERLAGPDAMGNLFKVLAILPRGVAVAPFAAES
jgi:SAM-dependent MidA family methyltransferase